MNYNKHAFRWATVFRRLILFALIWWSLTEDYSESWWLGTPTVTLCAFISVKLLPSVPFVWRELFTFTPFFLWWSLKGGLDVAWRVFHPRLPIAPELVDYPTRLPPGLPLFMFGNALNLLPGTLNAQLDGPIVKIHVLNRSGNFLPEVKALERRIARLSGVPLLRKDTEDHPENTLDAF